MQVDVVVRRERRLGEAEAEALHPRPRDHDAVVGAQPNRRAHHRQPRLRRDARELGSDGLVRRDAARDDEARERRAAAGAASAAVAAAVALGGPPQRARSALSEVGDGDALEGGGRAGRARVFSQPRHQGDALEDARRRARRARSRVPRGGRGGSEESADARGRELGERAGAR